MSLFLHLLEKFNNERVTPGSCFAYHEICWLKLRAEICLFKAMRQHRCMCGLQSIIQGHLPGAADSTRVGERRV